MEYILEGKITYTKKDEIMVTIREDKVEEVKFNFEQIHRDAVDLTWDDEIEMD